MKILVSGGAGYIGSVLCEHLLNAGHRVKVLDSLRYQQHSLWHLCHNERFSFVYGDCRDDMLMNELVGGMDAIIPLAALVGAPICQLNSWEAWSVNFDSIRILMTVRDPKQLVVFPTSNSGYGTKSGESFCAEDTPLEPVSIYGQTKVNAEMVLLDQPNTISLRLATVFGMSPRMRIDLMVNDFVHTAVTKGSINIFEKHFKRNYVHIRDVADCFLYCLEHPEMAGKAYNVGLDEANLSKEELAMLIQKHLAKQGKGFEITFSEFGKDPDKRNYIVSNERLRQAGFWAKRSLDDGIRELLKGYQMLGRKELANV